MKKLFDNYVLHNLKSIYFMTKATIFILCLLCVSLAHKDKKGETYSIYKPFNDMPKPTDNDILKTDEILINDHESL